MAYQVPRINRSLLSIFAENPKYLFINTSLTYRYAGQDALQSSSSSSSQQPQNHKQADNKIVDIAEAKNA